MVLAWNNLAVISTESASRIALKSPMEGEVKEEVELWAVELDPCLGAWDGMILGKWKNKDHVQL